MKLFRRGEFTTARIYFRKCTPPSLPRHYFLLSRQFPPVEKFASFARSKQLWRAHWNPRIFGSSASQIAFPPFPTVTHNFSIVLAYFIFFSLFPIHSRLQFVFPFSKHRFDFNDFQCIFSFRRLILYNLHPPFQHRWFVDELFDR